MNFILLSSCCLISINFFYTLCYYLHIKLFLGCIFSHFLWHCCSILIWTDQEIQVQVCIRHHNSYIGYWIREMNTFFSWWLQAFLENSPATLSSDVGSSNLNKKFILNLWWYICEFWFELKTVLHFILNEGWFPVPLLILVALKKMFCIQRIQSHLNNKRTIRSSDQKCWGCHRMPCI